MTQPANWLSLLDRALDQTGDVISRVGPEQASLPTPCPAWNVRALVNHVVLDVELFTAMTAGEGGRPEDRDVIGDDWTGAYKRAAQALRDEWRRPGVLDRTIQLPFGEFPATWRLGQQIADLAVHAWDIARATHQRTDLDREIAEISLRWARENLKPEFRGEESSGYVFGPEVHVPESAPDYDRLAGFFGRSPHSHLDAGMP